MNKVLVRNEEFRLLIFAVRFQKKHASPHVMRAPLSHEMIILSGLIARWINCCTTALSNLSASSGILRLFIVVLRVDHQIWVQNVCEVIDLLHFLIIQPDLLKVIIPEGIWVLKQSLYDLFVALF